LDSDKAAVVLAVDEGGAVPDSDIGKFLERDVLAVVE
jgi:hypothetical protein